MASLKAAVVPSTESQGHSWTQPGRNCWDHDGLLVAGNQQCLQRESCTGGHSMSDAPGCRYDDTSANTLHEAVTTIDRRYNTSIGAMCTLAFMKQSMRTCSSRRLGVDLEEDLC